jgi:hypothetical protein
MLSLLTLALSLSMVATAAPPDELVVFEDLRCKYCTFWEHDVGRIYDKTDEAKTLPLRRVDYRAQRPADLQDVAAIIYWPTFVVMHCGREFDRITGYNGPDQFWGLLDAAIRRLKEAEKSSSCPQGTTS